MPRNAKILIRSGATAPSALDFDVSEPAWDKVGKKLYIKANDGTMVEIAGGGGGGSGAYTISSTPPSNPASGDMWFDLDTGVEFSYINDGDSSQWVEAAPPVVGGGGGSGSYTASPSPPASPAEGDRWYDIDLGIEFTYVNDGNSSQWVENSVAAKPALHPIVANIVF